MFVLGTMLLTAEAGKNIARGLELLNPAADAHEENIDISNKALSSLAFSYLAGKDVAPDIRAARSYAMRGAAQCDGFSMIVVAQSYQMEEQFVRAYAWASVAGQSAKEQLSLAMNIKENAMKSMGGYEIAKGDALISTLPVCLPAILTQEY